LDRVAVTDRVAVVDGGAGGVDTDFVPDPSPGMSEHPARPMSARAAATVAATRLRVFRLTLTAKSPLLEACVASQYRAGRAGAAGTAVTRRPGIVKSAAIGDDTSGVHRE
jgi:hypothetical protein